MNNQKTLEEKEKIMELSFAFFKLGWNLAKFISNNEGFIFGATENRCEKEFWKIIEAQKKNYV